MPDIVRPELGPTLPTVLERRFGVRPRTLLLVLAALAFGLVLLAVAVLKLRDHDEVLVHRGAPQFTIKYDERTVEVAEPRAGELARLTSRRGRARAVVTVLPLRLPAYAGDASHALLPAEAERRREELERTFPGLRFLDEGKARVNGAPGYQVGYRHGETFGRDVLLLPDEEGADGGVTVRFAISRPGGVRPKDRRRLKDAKSAFRSFRFGTERP